MIAYKAFFRKNKRLKNSEIKSGYFLFAIVSRTKNKDVVKICNEIKKS